MIPNNNFDEVINNLPQASASYGTKSYCIDFNTKIISGYVENLKALKQSIFCILNTERYDNLIYSYDYGAEFQDLIGQDSLYIIADLHRRVEEALLQDDRILSVETLNIEVKGENTIYTGVVRSIYGEFEIDKEVEKL